MASSQPAQTQSAVRAREAVPAAWSAVSVTGNNGAAWLPEAGPAMSTASPGPPGGFRGGFRGGLAFRAGRGFGPGGGGALTFAGPDLPRLDPGLLSHLESHRAGARYLVRP